MNLFDIENLEASSALLELQWQFRASRVLMTAHQLGIFEALRETKWPRMWQHSAERTQV